MEKIILGRLLSAVYFLLPTFSFPQSCSTWSATHQSDIASTCNQAVMTMMHDELNRPYLYIANKEAGLKIYDISAIATPSLAATVPINLYDSLHVMNVSQSGNYLYLAIGNHFNSTQKSGMAIVDVTNPIAPTVTDFYELAASTGGSGIVKAEGNYAYLGAMGNGLIVLDITTKSNIVFMSQFKPDINWPVNNPTASLYNARGMEVKNSIVYLCFDAGGIRIVNCTNKSVPRETGRWCNPVMYTPLNHPKAYNNLVKNDTLLYVTVDYAGMEVLDVSDTSNITMTGWWNPYNAPNNNWFTSPSHANEIAYHDNCQLVYISTGKSDMMVVDVSNPAQPDSCNFYGGVSNNIGTWGIGFIKSNYQLYLSYICTLGIPFASNWTGVKLFNLSVGCVLGGTEDPDLPEINISPVPAKNLITVSLKDNYSLSILTVENVLGQTFHPSFQHSGNKAEVDVSELNSGCYFLKVNFEGKQFTKMFMK
ncbi:MAG: T9SS type A sorting domain-containing protein [Bacteroidetes bacterium]|nr:MAG: T9SS type A sorting domain-containing protein [Bacteroidota bacterium]